MNLWEVCSFGTTNKWAKKLNMPLNRIRQGFSVSTKRLSMSSCKELVWGTWPRRYSAFMITKRTRSNSVMSKISATPTARSLVSAFIYTLWSSANRHFTQSWTECVGQWTTPNWSISDPLRRHLAISPNVASIREETMTEYSPAKW